MKEAHFPQSLPPRWRESLDSEKEKPYFEALSRFVSDEYRKGEVIFPESSHILRALQALDLPKVKVVILGQDPYHGEGQAMGFAFGVPNALRSKPPSLKNIFKEVESDLGVSLPEGKSDLSGWVEQGVLLLNTVLTVRANQAFSHRAKGWEEFTDAVIRTLDGRADPVVFLLWGAAAQQKKLLIKSPPHFILESPHPSPLSAHRGFLGNRHFSKVNAVLRKLGKEEIHWERISV